jgi:hypothetical protein
VTVEFISLRFTVTFAVGLEVTTALLGHPAVVLPVMPVLPVVAVGDGEFPVEPELEPGTVMVPQAASMKVSAITSETAGKRVLRWRMCTVRMRLTPYITICLDFLRNID